MGFNFDNLTWRCDICHLERPDAQISVHKVDIGPKSSPGIVVRHVKYCNDSQFCEDAAKIWQEPRPVFAGIDMAARPSLWQRVKKLVSGR